jgi:hypothetical protein
MEYRIKHEIESVKQYKKILDFNYDENNLIIKFNLNFNNYKIEILNNFPFSRPLIYLNEKLLDIKITLGNDWSPSWKILDLIIKLDLMSPSYLSKIRINNEIKKLKKMSEINYLYYDENKLILTFKFNKNNYRIMFPPNYPFDEPIIYVNDEFTNITKILETEWTSTYNIFKMVDLFSTFTTKVI